ncbi:hypothetical protein GC176_17535 [bacterium]|nr:hypothetical protein [bacterium]
MRKLTVAVSAAAAVVWTTALLACSVPVFRYAIEQWNPDLFALTVYHNGELTEPQRALLQRLRPAGIDAAFVGNLKVETVDLASTELARLDAGWLESVSSGAAWLVAQTPAKKGPPTEVFSAEFTPENVERLLGSPKRFAVIERLLRGESAVWVLLECGNQEADDAAAEVLTTELARLQETLKLPEIDEKDIQEGLLTLDPAELKIRFSLVRVARNDPAEQAFVSMLLATEPDLNDPEFRDQPMTLPIFGRGRSLYALIGKGINRDTIEDTCRFLSGACQCTVKAQNPGVDILTTVDWNLLVGSAPESLQLERESLTGPPQYLDIAPGSSVPTEQEERTISGRIDSTVPERIPATGLLGLGGFAVLVAAVSLSAARRVS